MMMINNNYEKNKKNRNNKLHILRKGPVKLQPSLHEVMMMLQQI